MRHEVGYGRWKRGDWRRETTGDGDGDGRRETGDDRRESGDGR